MSFAKRVAVAVNFSEPLTEVYKVLGKLDFMAHSEVHFVSVHLTSIYPIGLGETSIIYPLVEDQQKIDESTKASLAKMAKEVFPKTFDGRIVPICLFGEDPKRSFTDYVNDHHIDMVVVAAREKRGLFESSFTQFVQKHTQANMLVLKKR